MNDLGDMVRQAQEMRDRFQRLQEELAAVKVEGSSGGGMVSVTANGRQDIVSVRIGKEVVSPDDIGVLQDLVCAAVNDALVRSRETMASEITKIAGGVLPPGLF
ncbi:MAG: YbaB/EbfC family nucleoid-associated protein [Syntrophorhabdaceae bacterium]|nr:YbaB/EbfC family nucleoid-associated protein [Syntrophorhabdaceae bacterium]